MYVTEPATVNPATAASTIAQIHNMYYIKIGAEKYEGIPYSRQPDPDNFTEPASVGFHDHSVCIVKLTYIYAKFGQKPHHE